jgi:formylmethanofuran dehydrogenase subunit E
MHKNLEQANSFRDFLNEVEPIRFREPFAETLGGFNQENVILEYSFIDVLKMAGHACPTTAAAYLCCQHALQKLYTDEMPVRGDISITIYGEPDEGVYGVISQVFSLLTGAAPATGFRGLGHKFKRKDLLKFSQKKIEPEALCFKFQRLENKKTVTVRFYPDKIPFPEGKIKRLGELLEKVVWEAAKKNEIREFQDLWMEKVRDMIIKRKDINEWIKIDEGG